ncbi:tyrosine--tRNA ligase [Clostridium cellulovorans]|uniref:Tyrosine--tRNA ligase n=1 Tax=Clostridium cellulovorans (strain ATCC 35296 / DSM 3052 / OCM 3 / 743B) TaxID=573061 RepID=D9SQH3_CLOC7|nr:tyrosine--tRNA ligase [Clostridium cellulovorans]ADL50239.1 tyrosyl-tRNA synthetase [Clostridium cellulovorans 743B]
MVNIDEQIKIIMKGVDEIIGLDSLKEKIEKANENGKPLIVKLGLDPSAPDIHLGHTVVLRKMKQLQDLGHKVIVIIGDFTGKIGDPTGKTKGRKALTTEQVLENARTYETQIFKVLDKDKTEVRFNSEWLSQLSFEETIKLAATMTVARMLEREEFKKRYENQVPISVHEFFYPLMQGYDSVAIHADIELGGTDQRFNVLMGRMLQKEYGQEPQTTIFMPLLEGLDGKEKMSKSLGNYIGIDEKAEVMYEKAMTVPDNLIIKYFNLVTDMHPDKVKELESTLRDEKVNPRDIKMRLAKEIVRLYHGEKEAEKAEERFMLIFQKGKIPTDIETVNVSENNFDIGEILVSEKFVASKSDLRRLIDQGGVKINNNILKDLAEIKIEKEMIVQVGKKKFIHISIA